MPCARAQLCITLMLTLSGMTAAFADTVYRCVGRDGVVAFQDQPCARHEPQEVLHLRDVPPPPVMPAAAVAPSPPVVTAKPAPPPAPRTPVPVLYSCTNAVNGNPYVSRNGHPQPYTAPLGMVNIMQQPLSQAFGAGSGTHLSAPETMRHPPSLGRGMAYSVWVRDACRRLSRDQVCAELRRESDDNTADLKYAFGAERGALERRATQLRAERAGCR